MYTDITFKNCSLNPHLPEVTLYQKLDQSEQSGLIAWKVIKNCQFQWTKPLRIYWDYSYQFFDGYGNFSPLFSTNTINAQYNDISISLDFDQRSISFKKIKDSEINGVCLLKNKQIIGSQSFNSATGVICFSLSNSFMICADLRVKEQAIINPININQSLKSFDITSLQKLNILMLGGQPGPYSKALHFNTSQFKKW